MLLMIQQKKSIARTGFLYYDTLIMRLTPDKKLHSRQHVLAEDLSRMLAEPKRFAAYLGIALRYDETDLRALARYTVEKKDLPVEARGKYFFASLKGLVKKSSVRKPKKKIRRVRQPVNANKKHGRKKIGRARNHKRARKGAPQKSG